MPEAVQLAVVRLASMVAWIGEHPGVSVNELATHFHRTRRQVRRDIDYLASVGDSMPGASFEIDWGLYEEEERVSLRSTMGASAPLRFSEAEAQALLIGLSALAPLLGSDLADRVPHAALVVCALGGLDALPGDGGVDLALQPPASATVDELREALTQGQRVEFDYVSARASSHRVVDPWSLEATATGWLLHGWCTRADAPRCFSVSSISNLRVRGPRTHRPRRVRQDATTWTLEVDREARWIADEYAGSIVEELAEGGARITLPVWNEEWGLSLLTDIASHLRGVDPDRRGDAAKRAQHMLSVWMQEESP